jgi:hypothetical protein
VLFGREAECAAVEGLIAAAASSRSGALVVRGEPGVGKSALLEHAIEQATGMQLLRWSGIEAESELAFAALHQLVRPILHRREQIAEPQAAALAGALGLSRASVEDRFLIGVGVLSLLAEPRTTRRSRAWSTTRSGSIARRPTRSRSPPAGSRRRASCCSSRRATVSCGASRDRACPSCGSAGSAPRRPGRCRVQAARHDVLRRGAHGTMTTVEEAPGRRPLDPVAQSSQP